MDNNTNTPDIEKSWFLSSPSGAVLSLILPVTPELIRNMVQALLRPHLHCCVFDLRRSLEAALLSSQTKRISHDHPTSHSTCSFKIKLGGHHLRTAPSLISRCSNVDVASVFPFVCCSIWVDMGVSYFLQWTGHRLHYLRYHYLDIC